MTEVTSILDSICKNDKKNHAYNSDGKTCTIPNSKSDTYTRR